jgi:hypothetical protein
MILGVSWERWIQSRLLTWLTWNLALAFVHPFDQGSNRFVGAHESYLDLSWTVGVSEIKGAEVSNAKPHIWASITVSKFQIRIGL